VDDRRSDVAELQRLQNGARPIADAKFRQDARRVILDGAHRGAERVRDLAVAVAAGRESEDFDLALGQRIRRIQRVEVR
jgi:hypothetical protein